MKAGRSVTFAAAFPILSTRDVGRLLGFYQGLLGGEIGYRFPADGDPIFVTVRIGEDDFGIAAAEDAPEGTGGQRFAMWVYADDCDVAIERLRAAGVAVVDEPADQSWGERMARVLDPDGNEVMIGEQLGASSSDQPPRHA
jgi:lactoylglutathione lyase